MRIMERLLKRRKRVIPALRRLSTLTHLCEESSSALHGGLLLSVGFRAMLVVSLSTLAYLYGGPASSLFIDLLEMLLVGVAASMLVMSVLSTSVAPVSVVGMIESIPLFMVTVAGTPPPTH